MRPLHSIQKYNNQQKSNNVLFVDGITRSGKFWLGNLLIHFDRMEHIQHHPAMDVCVHMNRLGMINDKAAAVMLRNEAQSHVYEMAIGRNINFRAADSSSVYKNPNFQTYLQRVAGKDVVFREVMAAIQSGDRIFLFIVHDWLCNAGLCFQAFVQPKVISIERNPIDLVYAWYKKGLGDRRAFSACLENKNGPLPWFVYKWIDEYESLNEMDRIIKSIAGLRGMAEEAFKNLPSGGKKRIIFTSYEAFAVQPRIEAEKIGNFLGTKLMATAESFFSQPIFKQRNKDSLIKSRKKKASEIKKQASRVCFSLLSDLNKQYVKSGFDAE
jgi:hypothetical protein